MLMCPKLQVIGGLYSPLGRSWHTNPTRSLMDLALFSLELSKPSENPFTIEILRQSSHLYKLVDRHTETHKAT